MALGNGVENKVKDVTPLQVFWVHLICKWALDTPRDPYGT